MVATTEARFVNSASATKKREVLQATTFGKPTAEEEGNLLSAYFVETDQWQSIYAGDIDVVYQKELVKALYTPFFSVEHLTCSIAASSS